MSDLFRPTSIITGHANADFDALAAMVAAGKLYPEALLLAPTMLERQGSNLFADSIAYQFNLRRPKECDLSGVRLLVAVDTHQAARLEHVDAVLKNPGMEIHVYDHHPDAGDGLPAAVSVVKPWGSCTSILTHILMERGIALNPDEATMLGLGIYEDTGSFTFNSTTEHDFTAAAYLRSFGMDLATIAELISSDLTREQIHVLDNLLRNAVVHTLQGIPVTITDIRLDDFMGDFATLVHKLIDMEHIKVMFALASMGDRVHLIGRSKLEEVDAGAVCASFGGGGHSFAASASVKDKTMAEIKAELLGVLVSVISPQMTVGRHMTSPAISADEGMSMAEAEGLMSRYGLKAAPIVSADDGRVTGMLELQTASRAVAHKLGDQPVTEYMQRAIRTLSPEAGLYDAMGIIFHLRQRLIPVVEHGALSGVITRTDVIRLLFNDLPQIDESAPLHREHRERDVAALLREQLPEAHVSLLKTAGRLGDELGMAVYAVGGFVRDLMLKQPTLDIDLSVEGDGIAFAEALAGKLNGRTRAHHKFRTAIVFYTDAEGGERHLDVATARLEFYEQPAALPTVQLSSIKMDLYRRDFTINALAIQLNAERFGALIDPFNAQRDIKEKYINVLHSLSFVEDPTRLLRAVRFERRFNFRASQQTERLIKNALSLDMLHKLSGSRLFNEMKHVFDEYDVPSCLRRMDAWNLLRMIHPMLKLNPAKDMLIAGIDEILAWYRLLYKDSSPRNWVVYLLGLCSGAKYPEVAELLERLDFIERARSDFMTLREGCRRTLDKLNAAGRQGPPPMSLIHDILHPLELEGLLFLMARHGQGHLVNQHVALYLANLREVKPDISGRDLAVLGETPGPLFGETLKYVLAAKLDGLVISREEQLALAGRYMTVRREGAEKASVNLTEVLHGRT
ncbi:MAG: CBS domain-containing protein [Desulfovibrio sp.]|jgi:tRNA nucleotidyltransferase (CCA-adding enzyme)|nr:CBS domain-containing protein [Desulfovibrio sp.]